MGDGVTCVVSFLDFHNCCDVVPLTSLRPFPIIAWVRINSNVPKHSACAVNLIPYSMETTESFSSL